MCRSIYVYVLFRTKGLPVTQSPSTPLPPPRERRRLREAASLTQAQLAARLGVPRGTVRGWEAGRAAPRGRKGEAYAKLLTALTGPEDSKPREPRPDSAPEPMRVRV